MDCGFWVSKHRGGCENLLITCLLPSLLIGYSSDTSGRKGWTMSDVAERVKDVLCELFVCDESEITEGTLLKDLGFDPLDSLELPLALEERFDCSISDEEAEEFQIFQTVGDVICFVERNLER